MKKSKMIRIFAASSVLSLSICSLGAFADERKYDDSTVSLSSAVERYVNEQLEENEKVVFDFNTVVGLADRGIDKIYVQELLANNEDATETEEQEIEEEIEEADNSQEEVFAESDVTVKTSYDLSPVTITASFSDKAIVKASGTVNIRENSSVDSAKVGQIGQNGMLTVVEKGAEWSLVTSGNCKGYIKNEFLVFGQDAKDYAEKNLTKVAVVTADSLNVRQEPSETAKCISSVSNGMKLNVYGTYGDWTKISVDASTSGYVKSSYVEIICATNVAEAVEKVAETKSEVTTQETNKAETTTTESTSAENATTESTTATTEPTAPAVTGSGLGQDIANYGLQFVGNPYVYGGTSLTNGTDCSGFTMSVYAAFGISIPRVASSQATVGTEVSLSELQPGDLVFYNHGKSYIDHVALYIGNGQVVHASTTRTGIIVANVNYTTPCKAVRIVN